MTTLSKPIKTARHMMPSPASSDTHAVRYAPLLSSSTLPFGQVELLHRVQLILCVRHESTVSITLCLFWDKLNPQQALAGGPSCWLLLWCPGKAAQDLHRMSQRRPSCLACSAMSLQASQLQRTKGGKIDSSTSRSYSTSKQALFSRLKTQHRQQARPQPTAYLRGCAWPIATPAQHSHRGTPTARCGPVPRRTLRAPSPCSLRWSCRC